MIKKTLFLDLDGVVVDFELGLIHAAGTYGLKDINNPDMVDELILKTPNFYEHLPPIPGAVEAAKTLFQFYDVYFLSTPMWGDPRSYTGKRIWVEKHFGELATKKLILTHRKDLLIGDYLIDDRTKHGAKYFTGVHIHFGEGIFKGWPETLAFLEKERTEN